MRGGRPWLGSVDPKHEAGDIDTADHEGDGGATEAWTDGRYAEDDKHVELDYELAVALANATEDPARAAVLKVTETEPSHGFMAWQALVDAHAPTSSNDRAIVLQPYLRRPRDAKMQRNCKKGSKHGH